MACFPRIDQPCPLGIDEQKRIDGYCGRCAKNVHALDAMSDAQRRILLRDAAGPICVTYRRPVARSIGIGLGATLAISVSASAFAIDVTSNAAVVDPAYRSIEPARPSLLGDKVKGPECDEAEKVAAESETNPLEFVVVGGVSDPAGAEWIDDSDLPDLPMINAPGPSGR